MVVLTAMRTAPLLLITLLMAACSGGRRLAKEAMRMEDQGRLEEAYKMWYVARDAKPKRDLPAVGLVRTGQQLLDRLEGEASSAYLAGDHERGEVLWKAAEHFRNSAKVRGVDLRSDPLLEQRKAHSTSTEAERRYAEAEQAYRQDRFSDVVDLTNRVLELVPDHREARYLRDLARVEPLYRSAMLAFERRQWRQAHDGFQQVLMLDPAYKDARERLGNAQRNGAYTMAIVTLESDPRNSKMRSAAEAIVTAAKEELLKRRDPFLILVTRDNTAALLAEQQRVLNGVYDDRSAAQAGRLLGARFVLTAKLLRYDEGIGRQIEMQVHLMDASTGRIHRSELVQMAKQEIRRDRPVRDQLIDFASKRMSDLLIGFDPEPE